MGRINCFESEKLIVGLLLSKETEKSSILSLLESRWGALDHVSPEFPFIYTNYYEPEMGNSISRLYVSFETLISPENLARIKIESNLLEQESATADSRRSVNIDPGLLSLDRIVLASTKNAGHRIPLKDGIFAELCLAYRNGGWETFPWTYPDYASSEARSQMITIRNLYKAQRRTLL